ncbi:NLE_(NUC135) domain-containing protein [Hexamita inflata]|uniref:NLE (NUC135) domain-containing protein n=1 Tax=Hexamita inflata TaxID=28002 RepID=A0AA86RAE5_9EUKA|nr:NLE (NUC135) domain-containing protein [Hexamita inflata]
MSVIQIRLVTKLDKPYSSNLAPMFVPSNSSQPDLSDLMSQLLELENVQFDFIIKGQFLIDSLQEHVKKFNLSAETIIDVEYVLALAVPQFKQELKVDDWVSKIVSLPNHQLAASSYDGSVSIFELDAQKQLQIKKTVRISNQAVTSLIKLSNLIIAGGYDGRVMLLDEQFNLKLEFTQNHIPVKALSSFYRQNEAFVTVLNEQNEIVLLNVSSNIDKQAENVKVGGKFERGVKIAEQEVIQKLEYEAHVIQQYTQQELLVSSKQAVNIIDLETLKSRGLAAPSPATCFLTKGETFAAGFMDRSMRIYDPRLTNPVVRTFLGHKSHVVSLKQRDNDYQMASCEIGGKILVWDIRSSLPYHQIDVYDSTMDKRSDQARVLDMEWNQDGYFIGGSARKIFWFE